MSQQAVNPYDLSLINDRVLTPIVESALNRQPLELIDWNHVRVHGGAGDVGSVLSGLFRFSGKAHHRDETLDWSLILKVTGTTDASQDPNEPRYWKRELLAYQSGQLGDLPGGLTSPGFFGATEFSEQIVGVWLEDMTDDIGTHWPLAHYGTVARHLGQFNGAYLTADELPAWPWMSRGWVRALVNGSATPIEQLRASADRPGVRDWYFEGDIERHLKVWDEREKLLAALDRLPQTFLHRDTFRRNLFARRASDGSEETVAVDWAYVGIGAVGEELASLVQASLVFSEIDMTDAHKLKEIVFDGYIKGLAEAGWHGDARLVRLGYSAGSVLIFELGYGSAPLDESRYAWAEQAFGLPIDDLKSLSAKSTHFCLDLADEARELIDTLFDD
jgi:hypothetical protein